MNKKTSCWDQNFILCNILHALAVFSFKSIVHCAQVLRFFFFLQVYLLSFVDSFDLMQRNEQWSKGQEKLGR